MEQLTLLMFLPMLSLQVSLFIMVQLEDYVGLEILDLFHFLTIRYRHQNKSYCLCKFHYFFWSLFSFSIPTVPL